MTISAMHRIRTQRQNLGIVTAIQMAYYRPPLKTGERPHLRAYSTDAFTYHIP